MEKTTPSAEYWAAHALFALKNLYEHPDKEVNLAQVAAILAPMGIKMVTEGKTTSAVQYAAKVVYLAEGCAQLLDDNGASIWLERPVLEQPVLEQPAGEI